MGKVEEAKRLLYGPDGLRVTNLKIFPGTSRDVTAEDVAEQIIALVGELKRPCQETVAQLPQSC